MAIVLGLLVAAAYGAGDFLGGFASRRSTVPSVMVTSQLAGISLLVVFVGIVPSDGPAGRDLALGLAVGVVGSIAVALLYRGLAVGRMSVVAPVTAVGSALIPLIWGVVAEGERPSPAAAVGVAVALAAVALVGGSGGVADETVAGARPAVPARVELGLAAGAGAGFGTGFVLLSETGDGAGMWPLMASRPTSVVLVAIVGLATRRALAPDRADRKVAALAGVLDITANALFLAATRAGLLSLVAPVAALYPAGTVLLARLVLDERLTRSQAVGLGLGAAAVVLIAAG